jgi:hypothetical protein
MKSGSRFSETEKVQKWEKLEKRTRARISRIRAEEETSVPKIVVGS